MENKNNNKKNNNIESLEDLNTLTDMSDECLDKTLNRVKSINDLRSELIKLKFNPEASLYFYYEIAPLLDTLYRLSSTSLNLSSSVTVLSTAVYLKPKDSKIKDTIKLIYDINQKCEDLYEALNKKIDTLICISKCQK